jgi:hypothetical protein
MTRVREPDAETLERAMRPLWEAADYGLRVDPVPHLVRLARMHHGEPLERPWVEPRELTTEEREAARVFGREAYRRRRDAALAAQASA